MNTENFTEENPLAAPDFVRPQKSLLKSLLVYLQLVGFVAGLALLGFVVYKIGFRTITDALGRVGWGFLFVVALNGSRHLLRALSLYIAVAPQHREFKFRYAVAARLGGEAVSFATFTGPFLGEATKAALLKKNVPLAESVTAVVLDNILYDVSVGLLVLGGVGMMFYVYGAGDEAMRYALVGVSAAIAIALAAVMLALRGRVKMFSWLLSKLSAKKLLPNAVERKKQAISDLEDNVFQFYRERRTAFFAVAGLIVFSHVLSFVEVYAVLSTLR